MTRLARSLRRFVLLPLGLVVALGVAAAGWYLSTRFGGGPPHDGVLVLRGATVLAGTGLEPLDDAAVVVRDGVIVEVGSVADVPVPDGAVVVDLDGATVLPGLIDGHVHLGAPERARGEEGGLLLTARALLEAVRHAPSARRALLAHGVTTVRSLGDETAWVLELRKLVAAGELEGPRVVAAGPVFTTRQGHPVATLGVPADGDGVRVPATPQQARREVRELARRGVDLVKVVQERGGERRRLEPLAPPVLEAIVAEAAAHDLPVVAHWGTPADLDEVLTAGVAGVEHLEARGADVSDAQVAGLVDDGVLLSPTLAVTAAALPAEHAARLQQRAGQLHAAGVTLLAGSDAGMPGVGFGAGLHRELQLLVAAGLTPREALRSATVEAAAALGRDDIGAIVPGRDADLLVVAGDPLADVDRIGDVLLVFRAGRLVVDRR